MIKKKKILVYSIVTLIVILTISCLITLLKCTYRVTGQSMEPTYFEGDMIIINSFDENFKINDIILFYYSGKKLIKKIIALENQIVEVKDNKIFVDDLLCLEFFNVGIENQKYFLKENEFFVVGENLESSYDSRNFGKIKGTDIIGKVA